MIIKKSNIKNTDLYKLATMRKDDLATLPDNAVLTVTNYAITEGKYQDGLVLQIGDGAYFTNERPIVDSFLTILSCFGTVPNLAFNLRTSNTTGKTYRVFVPVEG